MNLLEQVYIQRGGYPHKCRHHQLCFDIVAIEPGNMDRRDSAEYDEKVEIEQNVVDISDAARKAERKLRLKIDLFVVPTVTLLYLMCFIDRTNIGM